MSLTFGSLSFLYCLHFKLSLLSIKVEKLTLTHFFLLGTLLGKREMIRVRVLEQVVPLLKYFQRLSDCDLDLKNRKFCFVCTIDQEIVVFPNYCPHCRKSYCTEYISLLFQK